MKQKIVILMFAALTALFLMGCGEKESQSAAEVETITYHGEFGPDSHGWLIVADFEKKGEDIISATFDCLLLNKHEYVVDDGLSVVAGESKKDLSVRGIYDMKVGGSVLDWHEQIALVEEYFVENDSFDAINFDESGHDVDSVTAASIHYSEFEDAVAAAKPVAEAVFTIVNEGPRDSHGWEPFVIYQVKGGKIIEASIDCFLGDPAEYVEEGLDVKVGALKADLSREGIYDMKVGGAKLDWHEQAQVVVDYVVANQDFSAIKWDESGHDVDGVTGASIHFEEFAVLFN